MTPNNFQLCLGYSFDKKELRINLNKKTLCELKLNLARLNNLSITLNTSVRPHLESKSTRSDDEEFNIDELIYLLAEEVTKNLGENNKQAYLLKCYFQVSSEFKRRLRDFLVKKCQHFFTLKYKRIRGNLDTTQLKENWMRIIDQNCLVINESSLNSLNTLGKAAIFLV